MTGAVSSTTTSGSKVNSTGCSKWVGWKWSVKVAMIGLVMLTSLRTEGSLELWDKLRALMVTDDTEDSDSFNVTEERDMTGWVRFSWKKFEVEVEKVVAGKKNFLGLAWQRCHQRRDKSMNILKRHLLEARNYREYQRVYLTAFLP